MKVISRLLLASALFALALQYISAEESPVVIQGGGLRGAEATREDDAIRVEDVVRVEGKRFTTRELEAIQKSMSDMALGASDKARNAFTLLKDAYIRRRLNQDDNADE